MVFFHSYPMGLPTHPPPEEKTDDESKPSTPDVLCSGAALCHAELEGVCSLTQPAPNPPAPSSSGSAVPCWHQPLDCATLLALMWMSATSQSNGCLAQTSTCPQNQLISHSPGFQSLVNRLHRACFWLVLISTVDSFNKSCLR